ncbi:MAG: dihydroorotase [Firmicutes bacterium]|nr:dihydroorotase [Bacillota bacterium]
MELLLKGGILYDPAAGWAGPAEILIRENKVEAVSGSPLTVDVPVVNLQGKVVLPGLIDMHVHLREPGEEGKETIASGCAAAVAGGFTSLACMANTSPPADNKTVISYIQERVRKTGLARVYPLGTISKGLQGQELSNMWELASEGVKGFSDDGRPVMDSGLMLKAMQYALSLGLPIISHCEDLTIAEDGVVHAGPAGYRLGLPAIRPAAEAAMVARDLLLQEEVGGKLHFAHISSKKSVALLKWAAKRDVPFTAEVTPHHLFLTEEAVEHFSTDAKMNPPLREEADQKALLEALQEGLIGVIATDHAPHTRQDKEKDFLAAPFGVVGLETALPLVITLLLSKGLISWEQLVEFFSIAPSRILNIPGGTLAPGSAADLVVIDLQEERRVEKDNFYSRGRNTPFQGWTLKGFPVLTMVDGDIKMLSGRVKGFSPDFADILDAAMEKGYI